MVLFETKVRLKERIVWFGNDYDDGYLKGFKSKKEFIKNLEKEVAEQVKEEYPDFKFEIIKTVKRRL